MHAYPIEEMPEMQSKANHSITEHVHLLLLLLLLLESEQRAVEMYTYI